MKNIDIRNLANIGINHQAKSLKNEKYFLNAWWSDLNGNKIKEITIGEYVLFNIQMNPKIVPKDSVINITLKDWDGLINPDDKIELIALQDNSGEKKFHTLSSIKTDWSGKATLQIHLGDGFLPFINDDGGLEIELYFECIYYDKNNDRYETLNLPYNEKDYLVVYEKETLVTVLIELPHSKATGWGAIGLDGHSAMAIGEKYFDYGPHNVPGKYFERDYDYDFNNDGDKDDIVELKDPNFMFAPGQSWWGTHIARRKNIKVSEVTLDMVFEHIKLHWKKDETKISGEVHKIEFYVTKSQGEKMIEWWKNRYQYLKAYSVFPWDGEQCTTTVKSALQSAYPFNLSKNSPNQIMDEIQTPQQLLNELRYFICTSKNKYNQKAKETIIKKEAIDYP
ncbi:hypothetical protein [Chryseobacterium gambrini]|uniref:hypothetical protein n=1 Tax=Chryseobacterium gambrini TaxID=373672 RepID=UPI003D14152F